MRVPETALSAGESLYRRACVVGASFFGVGYAPVASGTFGTVAAIPVVWAVTGLSVPLQVLAAVGVTLLAIITAAEAGRHYGVVDARQIVIDEVAGFMITMLAVPFTLPNVIAGFLLFRLFDILKPWPASYFDRKVKNGVGVVLDDVMAGVYARGAMAGLALTFPGAFAGG